MLTNVHYIKIKKTNAEIFFKVVYVHSKRLNFDFSKINFYLSSLTKAVKDTR
jgi:hypothetical protein